MSHAAPRLAITMGDPAGIGPEIIAKACRRLAPRLNAGALQLLVIGHRGALHAASATLGETPIAEAGEPLGFVPAGEERAPITTGAVCAEGGRFAYLAVERAVRLAMDGAVDAIVTAPLNKEALNLAGHHFSGHTDMLASLTGVKGSVMLLVHGPMRVSHVTTHVALEAVPKLLTPERLRRVIDLTVEAVRALGIACPRLAVAALNPHAGEGGLFGRQDIDITAPVVAQCVADGLDVAGPTPGDTVFVKLRARQFDAVVAMYHDQGHIPVKLLGFDVDPESGAWRALSGVNVTLGLPIIRTSVDHGTAFDIAGKGVASEESLIEAIDLAVAMAARDAPNGRAAGRAAR
jgi:4-hydroxythreonine-4-phosphate dehydrogenase